MDNSKLVPLSQPRSVSKPKQKGGDSAGPPSLLLLIWGALFTSQLIPGRLLGYNLGGWLWVLILVASLLFTIRHVDQVSLPVWLWLPWMVFLMFRADWGDMLALQSTAQILCSVVVGMAASSYRASPSLVEIVHRWIRYGFYGFAALFILRVLPWAMEDIEHLGFATGAITSLFFQAYFLCCYLGGGKRQSDFVHFLIAFSMPIICANRGPLAGSLALCLFVLAPLSTTKRIMIGVAAILLGIAAFHTPKIQHKMFYSGQGGLDDLRMDNPDFNWSGRLGLWELLEGGLAEKPWLGHGANGDAEFLRTTGAATYALHNDWLRLRYNYGWVGAILFGVTIAVMVWMSYKRGKKHSDRTRTLLFAGASCFVPFAVVMYSDNILIYCQYFTAPHFFILGIAYASAKWEAQHSEAQLAPLVASPQVTNTRCGLRRRMLRPLRRGASKLGE